MTAKNVPQFVTVVQVKATARAGVFLQMQTSAGATAYAPLARDVALKLVRDINEAVAVYDLNETLANVTESVH